MLTSLDRGIQIMKYIAINRCASVSEIAQEFDVDKSTASRILSVLARHDLVYKKEGTMKYYSSVGTLLFSTRTISNSMILDEVRPCLRQLAEKVNMTAQIGVFLQNRIFLIDQVKGKDSRFVQEPAFPGMDEPFHCSALGKCILAHRTREEFDSILETFGLFGYTDKTITDPQILLKEMETVRQQGYAIDNGELSPMVFCLAVPVFDREGNVTFSLGVSGNTNFPENERLREYIVSEVKKAAEKLQRKYSVKDIV